MIIINYYKGNGCFVGHFFCVDTQFSLDEARIERPQICRLLYFIILMQPFTNPRNFRKVFVYVQIVCRTSAYFAINGH